MNDATDDLHSNEVDREYWIYLRLAFLRDAKTLVGKARAIAERLAATTDDLPAQLVEEQQQFWNDASEDNTWKRFYELEDVHYAMIEEIARGESAPENATVFVMEFIRRVTGRAGVLMSFRQSSEKHCAQKKRAMNGGGEMRGMG
jgi:5-methylthioribose kinase